LLKIIHYIPQKNTKTLDGNGFSLSPKGNYTQNNAFITEAENAENSFYNLVFSQFTPYLNLG